MDTLFIVIGVVLALCFVLNYGLGAYAEKIERDEKKKGFKEY